jgi:hypothetical protein
MKELPLYYNKKNNFNFIINDNIPFNTDFIYFFIRNLNPIDDDLLWSGFFIHINYIDYKLNFTFN